MNSNATKLVAGRNKPELAAPLHIVLTYDHPAAANAARKMLAGLLAKCADDLDMHRDEWSFAELEHPKCRTEALELAAPSDVFTIAVSGANDVPVSFVEWLNEWLEARNETETAMILALGSPRATMGELPLCASLLSLPRADGLSIFTTTIDLPQSNLPAAIKPASLCARLGSIKSEWLPEDSGLNE